MTVLRADGTARIKIISPGVGSSGYYSSEVLKASAAKFANAQCFWDHPTPTEESQRPERSLRDLAGKINGPPQWDANGPTGPGIYADVQVFKPYQGAVEELAPHIGMSIRALGRAKTGDVNGQKGPIIEGIDKVRSVDFVTAPGRGGEILQLFEAARGRTSISQEVSEMATDQEIQALREAATSAQAETARLWERLLLRDARDYVTEKVAERSLPAVTRRRLVESLSVNPPVRDGELDRAVYQTIIDESVRAEVAYLAEVGGGGRVLGLGPTASGGTAEEAEQRLAGAFRRLGLGESAATSAAAGRR